MSDAFGSTENPLTDHAYDGIEEYDNPLPGWWKWMFIGSIVFSVFYLMYFHIGAPGRSIADQYDVELQANAALQFKDMGALEPNEETLARALNKDGWLSIGQGVFKANCVSCHGREGEGGVGPNLTDDFYKNVRNLEDFLRVLNKGAGNGAMPAWGNRLQPNEIILVSAYVASLRGTEAKGKGPEGNEIAPWPEAAPEPVEAPGTEAAESTETS